ncbi:hypothetical protein Glove_460g19 [Diversispora epigaea]|uniref:Uncharacterized protein n=1 Tax=Diversispora epigaea TaxID=1348612 RepID=A0A397GSD4_9GLOM|nr:hypothetical protein Glove_460g19 [Diversispora epigaea]
MRRVKRRIYEFLTSAENKKINAISVVYLGMKEDHWIAQNELRAVVNRAVDSASNSAFEGVNNFYDMGAIKIDKEQSLSSDQIAKNVDELKRKLDKDISPLYQCLYSDVNKIPVQELTWKDPLASQVIRNNSDLIQKLPGNFKKAFMKPVKLMKPILIPRVEDMCKRFVSNFSGYNNYNRLPEKLIHDRSWKESEEKISCVVSEILDTLEDI